MAFIQRLDRVIGFIVSVGRWLAVPVVVLLFLQWPLRDIVRAYSREANDFGQWVFALYVAISFTAATRARTHLAADAVAHGYSPTTRATLWRIGVLVALVPWALFLLVAGQSIVLPSLAMLERFPDTNNPGYFFIKMALWVLAGLALAQAVIEVLRTGDSAARPDAKPGPDFAYRAMPRSDAG